MTMPRFTYPPLRLLLVAAVLAPAACTFPKSLGDDPNIHDTSGSGDTASTGTPTTGGEPLADECSQIVDKAECDAAGCSEFYADLTFWRLDENDHCVQDDSAPRCLWFPGDTWGGNASPGPFYEKATGLAVMFEIDWTDPPHGFGKCGDPDAPPACKCVTQCVDLQSQAAQFLEDDLPCNDVSDCVMADAICFNADTCGAVGVHKDSLEAWSALDDELDSLGCCDGANACGPSLACENNRCKAVFP